jgi:pilus assembly protein CpaB
MRRGGRVLVLLGIILGLITAGGTFLVLSTSQPQIQQVPTQPVVIALQNIPARTEINPQALGIQQWPEPIPPGASQKIEDVAGKLATVPIYPGQILLQQMYIDKAKAQTTGSNASYIIPDGKVAVAFSINLVSGVANALQPGDSVDILLTLNPSTLQGPAATTTAPRTATTGTEGQPVTQLMLQDIPILQVGSWAAAPASSGQQQAPAGDILTFVLDRQDALALKSASEQGSIQLVLRPAGDHKQVTTEPVTLQYLNKRFNFNLLPATR